MLSLIIILITEKVREQTLNLVSNAYTSINKKDLAQMLHISNEELVKLGMCSSSTWPFTYWMNVRDVILMLSLNAQSTNCDQTICAVSMLQALSASVSLTSFYDLA